MRRNRKFVVKVITIINWNISWCGFNWFVFHADAESGIIEG